MTETTPFGLYPSGIWFGAISIHELKEQLRALSDFLRVNRTALTHTGRSEEPIPDGFYIQRFDMIYPTVDESDAYVKQKRVWQEPETGITPEEQVLLNELRPLWITTLEAVLREISDRITHGDALYDAINRLALSDLIKDRDYRTLLLKADTAAHNGRRDPATGELTAYPRGSCGGLLDLVYTGALIDA